MIKGNLRVALHLLDLQLKRLDVCAEMDLFHYAEVFDGGIWRLMGLCGVQLSCEGHCYHLAFPIHSFLYFSYHIYCWINAAVQCLSCLCLGKQNRLINNVGNEFCCLVIKLFRYEFVW